MIGNDIVDLELAAEQSNWQRKGFLSKVFTKNEVDVIWESSDPFLTVWLFWSMKESAYKAYVQQSRKRFFNPKKLECQLTSENGGIVQIEGYRFKTKSVINDDHVHTIAILERANSLYCMNIFRIPNGEDRIVQAKLKIAISKKKNLALESLNLLKCNAGIPKMYHHNKEIGFEFSLSHHGNYGAYAILN